MKSCFSPTALLAALALAVSGPVAAASLFDRMGGEPVLRAAVEHFTDIVINDDRINFTFAESDLGKFKQLLYEQLCALSAGPCHYTGRDMRESHAKLDITTSEFDALTEDLYLGLRQAGVPYRLQNKLVAMLAPMKRDIVKRGPRSGAQPAPTRNAAGEQRRD